MKLAAAKSRLESRLAGLGLQEREVVLKSLSADWFSPGQTEELHECPACGQTGIMTCELYDVGQPEFEYEQVDRDEFIYHGGHIDQSACAVNFWCETCGLNLDYDEMEAAEMVVVFDREPRECDEWEFEYDRD